MPISRSKQIAPPALFRFDSGRGFGVCAKREFYCKEVIVMLLTKEIRSKLPALYSQDAKGGDAIVVVKFFDPCGSWTWYATEFDGEDRFFGLVDGSDKELGYFSLSELQNFKNRFGLGIERDLHWTPKPLREIAPELFK